MPRNNQTFKSTNYLLLVFITRFDVMEMHWILINHPTGVLKGGN